MKFIIEIENERNFKSDITLSDHKKWLRSQNDLLL